MCSSNNTFFCTHHEKHKTEHAMTFESASVLNYARHHHGGRCFLRSGQMIWQNRAWRAAHFLQNSFLSFNNKNEKKIWQMCRLILPMPLIGSERGRSLAAALPPGGCNIRKVFLTDGTAAAQWLVNTILKKNRREYPAIESFHLGIIRNVCRAMGLLLRHLMAFIGP